MSPRSARPSRRLFRSSPVLAARLAVLAAALVVPAARGDEASAAADLRERHAEADGPGFLERIDRAIWEDLVGDLPAEDRPIRPPVDAERLVASLGPVTGFVAIHPEGDEVFALVATTRGISTAILDSPGVVPMANRFAAWAADPAGTPFDPRAAFSLYAGILHPLQDRLARVRRLVISASGPLAGVPFEAMLLYPEASGEPPRGPWLGARYEVVLEPTPGARLAWAPSHPRAGLKRIPAGADGRPDPDSLLVAPGDLVAGAGEPGRAAALLALTLARSGARGALLGPFPGGDPAEFLGSFVRARAGGRHSDPVVVAGLKFRARRTDPTANPAAWAFPLLYGGR